MIADKFNIRIERSESGRTEFICETMEEFEIFWKMMAKGFHIRSPGGETWVPPRDVFIQPEGEFLFKPKAAK